MLLPYQGRHGQVARLLKGLESIRQGDGALHDHAGVLDLNESGETTHLHTRPSSWPVEQRSESMPVNGCHFRMNRIIDSTSASSEPLGSSWIFLGITTCVPGVRDQGSSAELDN